MSPQSFLVDNSPPPPGGAKRGKEKAELKSLWLAVVMLA